MTWPDTPDRLAQFGALVQLMRDLGVASAFGVVLGPAPSKLHELSVEARTAGPARKAQLDQEIAAELRASRIAALCEEYRDKLAATGVEYTDAQILERFVPPERMRQIEALDA